MSVLAEAKTSSETGFFARDKGFWNNYLKGRPSPPDAFFDRIFAFHRQHNGKFGVVHDVGAGNGPYAQKLRSKFQHVIVSDIVPQNISLAEDRLGSDGYSFRVAPLEDSRGIPDGSVDLIFASNVMHFCDQYVAMDVIAKQLRSGGTFAGSCFGSAHFEDAEVNGIYARIIQAGGRGLLRQADDPSKILAMMVRTQGSYNVAPLDASKFLPGAQRVHLNFENGGITAPLPPEYEADEPCYTGPTDVQVFEREEGWRFLMDLDEIRAHVESFPFTRADSGAFIELWDEMKEAVRDRTVAGYWPVKIILATRS